jgi:hypothetical protein
MIELIPISMGIRETEYYPVLMVTMKFKEYKSNGAY